MAIPRKPRTVAARKRLTFAYISSILSYSPKTGDLIWKSRRPGIRAGYIVTKGYRQITIDGIAHMAHHIAWLLKTKKWPERLVDHKNINPADNRWRNLRKCTASQNKCNQKTTSNNRLGHKCITFKKNRFTVRISLHRKMHTIGHFKTLKEAIKARNIAGKKLHGAFARFH